MTTETHTCHPTVEHHCACRSSVAVCWTCGRSGAPYHWPSAVYPHEAVDMALAGFNHDEPLRKPT